MRAHLEGCPACEEDHDSLLAFVASEQPPADNRAPRNPLSPDREVHASEAVLPFQRAAPRATLWVQPRLREPPWTSPSSARATWPAASPPAHSPAATTSRCWARAPRRRRRSPTSSPATCAPVRSATRSRRCRRARGLVPGRRRRAPPLRGRARRQGRRRHHQPRRHRDLRAAQHRGRLGRPGNRRPRPGRQGRQGVQHDVRRHARRGPGRRRGARPPGRLRR